MTTDDLARTALMGVLVTLLAFEFVAATASWMAVRLASRRWREPVLWLSRPVAIRQHLENRRRTLDAVRWQYPVLRSTRHGHEIRDAIRGLSRPSHEHLAAMRAARARHAFCPVLTATALTEGV